MGKAIQFFEVVQGQRIDLENEDNRVWKDGYALSYTVKSAYNHLRGVEKGRMSQCTNSFGGVKLCLLHQLVLGGCWKIRLLLGSIWKAVRLRSKVLCVVYVGWMRSFVVICSLSVELLGLFGVNALLGSFGVNALLGVIFVSHNDSLLNFFQFRICNTTDSVNDVWGAFRIVVVSEI